MTLKGIITSYRRSKRDQRPNQMLVQIEGITSRNEAAPLAGRKVIWKTETGKEFVGKITAPHGGKGIVRVRFKKGLPGTAIGTDVIIK